MCCALLCDKSRTVALRWSSAEAPLKSAHGTAHERVFRASASVSSALSSTSHGGSSSRFRITGTSLLFAISRCTSSFRHASVETSAAAAHVVSPAAPSSAKAFLMASIAPSFATLAHICALRSHSACSAYAA